MTGSTAATLALVGDGSLRARIAAVLDGPLATADPVHAEAVLDLIRTLSTSQPRSLKRPAQDDSQDPDSSAAPAPKRACPDAVVPAHVVKDVTAVCPLRRKMDLVFSTDQRIVLAPPAGVSLGAKAPDADQLQVPYDAMQKAVLVAVPDKAKPQSMLVVFGEARDDAVYGELAPRVLAATVPEHLVAPKDGGEAFAATFQRLTNHALVSPTTYKSRARTASGKPGNFAHLACHVKGKEGFLWLLPDGLVYGLKKPLLWIPHARIAAMSIVPNGRAMIDVHVEARTSADATKTIMFDNIAVAEADAVNEYIRSVRKAFGAAARKEETTAAEPTAAAAAGGGGKAPSGGSGAVAAAAAAATILSADFYSDNDDTSDDDPTFGHDDESGSEEEEESGESGDESGDDEVEDEDDGDNDGPPDGGEGMELDDQEDDE
ncbi:hypothetical protein AMAG_05851 [Allomyces macrogynus ATCC 38327]|uniref:Histone chaperone RTT106/FACT complex subunit SPT16-like middle domain-containing protein n=1 Tax=Allomyces macrogynus (strain ATCC 38327) TaxID=578462 RepID=A0A0L0SDK6_ALLM3|nr:hypothetical protein AMAG_05851 [Allomyces macrogynus ATCC 38327]|eukprot:KNE60465.1 hypothetical protein AMAG_05851 [Allomyces macrogynus ATCC 38327]